MFDKTTLEGLLRTEATRLIQRHEARRRRYVRYVQKRNERSSAPPISVNFRAPARWEASDGFNPFKVRSRAQRIAHGMAAAFAEGSYRPHAPIERRYPKGDGQHRTLNLYQVADSAISRFLFRSVLEKNLPLISGRAYAYRSDLGAQNAINYITSEFRRSARLYVADYDFAAYFDTLKHDHLFESMRENFVVTERELTVLRSFVSVGPSTVDAYSATGSRRARGVPQGTSVSLLLANVAAWELDRALDGLRVNFTRYADDLLIWSESYAAISEAVATLHEISPRIGAEISREKSDGITLMSEEREAEIRRRYHVDYLGYRLTLDSTRPSDAAEKRFKKRVSNILYQHLLQEPIAGTQSLARIPPHIDKDYVSCIWRLRRYLYGDLNEARVRKLQFAEPPKRRYFGFVAGYPIADDLDFFRALDGWLASAIEGAIAKRGRHLRAHHPGHTLPPPHGLTRDQLKRLQFTSAATKQQVDVRLPSVTRMARLISEAARIHGPTQIGHRNPDQY